GDPVAEWVLGTVFLTSDGISGAGAAIPAESLQVLFGLVTEATSAHLSSWNQQSNSNNGPAPAAGVTLSPITPTITISGVAFRDFNLNTQQDGNEPGFAGQTIFLDLNDNGIQDAGEPSTTTDSNGAYSVQVAVPGSFVVREVLLGGDILSLPATGGYSLNA